MFPNEMEWPVLCAFGFMRIPARTLFLSGIIATPAGRSGAGFVAFVTPQNLSGSELIAI